MVQKYALYVATCHSLDLISYELLIQLFCVQFFVIVTKMRDAARSDAEIARLLSPISPSTEHCRTGTRWYDRV